MILEKFINTGQGLFHSYVIGEGRSRVHFSHGNSLSAGTYLPFLEKLAGHQFKIYATDIRGHGYSTKENTAQVQNWDMFITDLEQVVSTITTPPVIGIGHSFGGYLTYAAAAVFPHLFARVILLDPIIFPQQMVWMAALLRKTGLAGKLKLARMTRARKSEFESRQAALMHYTGKGMFRSWHPEYVRAYVNTAIEKDTADTWSLCCHPEFEAQIYESVPFNTWQHADRIRVPVLVVRGQDSDLFSRAAGLGLTKKINHCTFVEQPGNGHFLMMEDPENTIDILVPFMTA